MSLPAVVNARGIGAVVPLHVDPAEGEALTKSAEAIRDQIAPIEGA
jgi:malate/lactate dehydrogenase